MENPKYAIRAIAPGQQSSMLEHVVIGGVAFFLDHENELVVPMDPS